MRTAVAPRLFVDGRWRGQHGIGRFATELIRRIARPHRLLRSGGNPASPLDPLRLSAELMQARASRRDLLFSPGFNAPLAGPCRALLTVHDLIHLHVPEERSALKSLYYERVVRPAIRRCGWALTVSAYSAAQLADWSGLPLERVAVLGNGVADAFSADGPRHMAPRPYFFYVGNRKPHKNVGRLLQAFAELRGEGVELMLSGHPEPDIQRQLHKLGLTGHVQFAGALDDLELAARYRAAVALVIPSLYEGFGMPALEAMACACPVIAANVTSLPEVVGEAALRVDPQDTGALVQAMRTLLLDTQQRARLSGQGLVQARHFTWDEVAQRLERVLDACL